MHSAHSIDYLRAVSCGMSFYESIIVMVAGR